MESHEKDKESEDWDPVERFALQSDHDQVDVLEIPIADIDISEFCRRQSYEDLDGWKSACKRDPPRE